MPFGSQVFSLTAFFTWSGVSDGLCWSSRATAPETIAAAWEVPLPRNSVVPTRADG